MLLEILEINPLSIIGIVDCCVIELVQFKLAILWVYRTLKVNKLNIVFEILKQLLVNVNKKIQTFE